MRKIALAAAGFSCAALAFALPASADPIYPQDVRILTPPQMRCEVSGPTVLYGGLHEPPSVYCQGAFANAPGDPCPATPGQNCAVWTMHQDQAFVKDTGEFGYQDGNLGLVQPNIINAVAGQSYHIQGWTVAQTADSATFTNDATGHGMTVTVDASPSPQGGYPQADVKAF
jgi:hypothetical protein